MKIAKRFWPLLLLFFVVILFFNPIFKGNIPFPGDLLVNQNPYSAQSYLGFAQGGYPTKNQGADVINEIYPWRYFSIDQMKSGNLPFWNPHNFSGNPQMANFQTSIFYPFNILYLILPFNVSWTLIILLQPLLAAAFMYLFLRKGIGLDNIASVIGGISFAFCSYMVVWIEYGNIGHTILWLPLILLITKSYFEKPTAFKFMGLSLILSTAILAGYIQGMFYVCLISCLYYGYLTITKEGIIKHKKNLFFVASFVLPIIITLFQLLPTLDLFSSSTRGSYSLAQIEKILAPLYSWITVFFPDFFGNPASRNYWIDGTYIERVLYPGSVILFFAFYALFGKANFTEKRFFTLTGLVSLVIATNLPFIKFLYLIPIPVVTTTVPTREFSIFIFSAIVLGAIGIDKFLTEKEFSKKYIVYYLGFVVLAWILTLIASRFLPQLAQNLTITLRNLILPTTLICLTIFAAIIKKKNIRISFILLIAIVLIDLLYFFNKITPFTPSSLTYPKTPIVEYLEENAGINRFWGYGSAYISPNFQSVDKTFSPEGNDPLHLVRYGELMSSTSNGKVPVLLPRPDANIASGYGPDDLKTNKYRKQILDLLGVKYILHKQELVDAWYAPDLTTFPKEDYDLVYKVYPWQVYENKSSLPRAFVTGRYVLAKDKKDALSKLYNLGELQALVLESKPSLEIDSESRGTLKINNYSPNYVKIEAEATGNSLIFLSDNYYKEWIAKIDGVKSPILIADYTFRAVEFPKGKHTVEFVYTPASFNTGLVISLFGLLLLASLTLYLKRNENKI